MSKNANCKVNVNSLYIQKSNEFVYFVQRHTGEFPCVFNMPLIGGVLFDWD